MQVYNNNNTFNDFNFKKKNKTFLKLNDFFVICLTAQEYNTILT